MMATRIVSWNMQAATVRNEQRDTRAWEALRSLRPDFALLQEVRPPRLLSEEFGDHLVFAPKRSRSLHEQDWGSAIVSFGAEIHALAESMRPPWLHLLWGGTVVTYVDAARPLWLASIHSSHSPLSAPQLDSRSIADAVLCADPDAYEIDVLLPDLVDVFGPDDFIVGGDLNSSVNFSSASDRASSRRLFDHVASLGFDDLRSHKHSTEQPTYFRPGAPSYQLDHLFAHERIGATVTDWRVEVERATTQSLSDHAPIVVDLDFSPEIG